MKVVYSALIRSILDYGLFLQVPCNKSALATLDRVQSRCLQIITGFMKSSPNNGLQVECSGPPLALRKQYFASRFILKFERKSIYPL